MTKRIFTCAVVASCVGLAMSAQPVTAAPILINTILTGDPRPDSPDGLKVNVSVTGDTASNVTWWTVDLDLAAYHPYARLNEFGFNLLGSSSNYVFSNFNLPYTPTIGKLDGSGNTQFMLTLDDPSGNKSDATNIKNLTFRLTKSTGAFTVDDFVLAPVSCSSDSWLGCNQLGAHLQALGSNAQDSGVAIGDFTEPVPEPGTIALLGAGLVAAVGAHRRRKQAL